MRQALTHKDIDTDGQRHGGPGSPRDGEAEKGRAERQREGDGETGRLRE